MQKTTQNHHSLLRNFRGAQQGPRREIVVAQLAMGYLHLRQSERQKDGVAATFIPPVHDVYNDIAPYMPSTGNLV